MRRPLRSDEARAIANLAIELGDPGRMAKARRLHRSNAVGEVDVRPSAALTGVTGADGELHEVSLVLDAVGGPGDIPSAVDVVTACSCDDHGDACVHALAAMLGLAETIEAEPDLLATWTGADDAGSAATYTTPSDSALTYLRGRWTDVAEAQPMSPVQGVPVPRLIVDDVDAGPVVIDAIDTIKRQLSSLRAR